MIIEDFAIKYADISEGASKIIGFGILVIGFIFAVLIDNRRKELARAPYFVYFALISLGISAVQIVWLQSLPAMRDGYLWVLVAISLVGVLIGGVFYGKIAMARSRDAFGHGKSAVLALIPLANLVLLLAPSKNTISANRVPTSRLIAGGLGVLSGFIILSVAVTIPKIIEEEARRIVEQAGHDPLSQQVGIDFMVRSKGLNETLRLIAAEAQTPITVDKVTTISRIEADGTQLRRIYVVDLAGFTISDKFRVSSTNAICAYGPFITLLREGATIREVYFERDSTPIGAVMVTRDTCGF